MDFKCLAYSFRLSSVFLASMDLENIITLVFTGLSLILHLAHHIASFRRACYKSFAAICMFRLKAHGACSIISDLGSRVLFVVRCWKVIDVNQEK